MYKLVRKSIAALFLVMSLSSAAGAQEVLSWQDALREASKNHPDVIAAQESILQERSQKTITASNGLPQVSAGLNASTSSSDSSGNSKSFDYGVSGSQLLFDGLRTVNDIRSANQNIKAAQENYKFTSATVRFRLRIAFIDLLKAQEFLSIAQEIYNIRKSNMDLIELRYQSGTEHRGALLTAKANLSQSEFDVAQAGRGLEVSQRQLTKEMGRREFTPITVKGDFQVVGDLTNKPNFKTLAQNNPELLKTIAQKNAAAFNVNSSKGNLLPEISLNGNLSRADNQWPPQEQGSSAGVRVSLPLFEGGANLARISQFKSIYRQLEQQERSTQDEIVLSLAQAWSQLEDAVEQVKVQKDFLTAAEERAKISQQQYSIGLISFDNWTIIEDDLVRNKKSFLDTQANALSAEANWVQAKGETLEYEN